MSWPAQPSEQPKGSTIVCVIAYSENKDWQRQADPLLALECPCRDLLPALIFEINTMVFGPKRPIRRLRKEQLALLFTERDLAAFQGWAALTGMTALDPPWSPPMSLLGYPVLTGGAKALTKGEG